MSKISAKRELAKARAELAKARALVKELSSAERADTDSYNTADDVCARLGPVDTDPCSNPWSAVLASTTYSLDDGEDGLKLPWFGLVFINPPFSDPMPWIRKAARHSSGVIFLMKYDPSTKWFARLQKAGAVNWPCKTRRLYTYQGEDVGSPNFPSFFATLRTELPERLRALCWQPERLS